MERFLLLLIIVLLSSACSDNQTTFDFSDNSAEEVEYLSNLINIIEVDRAYDIFSEDTTLHSILEQNSCPSIPTIDQWFVWKNQFINAFNRDHQKRHTWLLQLKAIEKRAVQKATLRWLVTKRKLNPRQGNVTHVRELFYTLGNKPPYTELSTGITFNFIYSPGRLNPVIKSCSLDDVKAKGFLRSLCGELDPDINILVVKLGSQRAEELLVTANIVFELASIEGETFELNLTIGEQINMVKKALSLAKNKALCEMALQSFGSHLSENAGREFISNLSKGEEVIGAVTSPSFGPLKVMVSTDHNGKVIVIPTPSGEQREDIVNYLFLNKKISQVKSKSILGSLRFAGPNVFKPEILKGICHVFAATGQTLSERKIYWEIGLNGINKEINLDALEDLVSEELLTPALPIIPAKLDELDQIIKRMYPKMANRLSIQAAESLGDQIHYKLNFVSDFYPDILIPGVIKKTDSIKSSLDHALSSKHISKISRAQWAPFLRHPEYGITKSHIINFNADDGKVKVANDILVSSDAKPLPTVESFECQTGVTREQSWRDITEQQAQRMLVNVVQRELTGFTQSAGLIIRGDGKVLENYLQTGKLDFQGTAMLTLPWLSELDFQLVGIRLSESGLSVKDAVAKIRIKEYHTPFELLGAPFAITDPSIEFDPQNKTFAFSVKITPGFAADRAFPFLGNELGRHNIWTRLCRVEIRGEVDFDDNLLAGSATLVLGQDYELYCVEARAFFAQEYLKLQLLTDGHKTISFAPSFHGQVLYQNKGKLDFNGEMRLLALFVNGSAKALFYKNTVADDDSVVITGSTNFIPGLTADVEGKSDIRFKKPKLNLKIRSTPLNMAMKMEY